MNRIRGYWVSRTDTTIYVKIDLIAPQLEISTTLSSSWPRNPLQSKIKQVCLGGELQFPAFSGTGIACGPEIPLLKEAVYQVILEAIGDELVKDIS